MGHAILLLGGSGYLGSKLRASLLEHGHAVIAPRRSEFNVLEDEYRLRRRLQALINSSTPNIIVNLISAGQGGNRISSGKAFHVNALFPEVLIGELAERGGTIRLIHVASATESKPGERGESLYSETKAIGSSFVEESLRRQRIPGALLRLHNVYGPDQPKGRLVRDLIEGACRMMMPTLTYPDRSRDFVFEHDAVQVLTHAIVNDHSGELMVELRTGQLTTLRTLQEVIASLVWEGADLTRQEFRPIPGTTEGNGTADPHQYPLIRFRQCPTKFKWTTLNVGLRTTINRLRSSSGAESREVCGNSNV